MKVPRLSNRTCLVLSRVLVGGVLVAAGACVPSVAQPPPPRKAGFVDDKIVLVPPGAEVGARFAKSHQWPEAIEAWREAGRVNPRSHALRYNLGLAHEMQGDREAAESAYRHAITLREEPLYVASLARVTGATGTGKQFFRHLAGRDAVHGAPDAADRGEVYARQGLWQEAVQLWAPACETQSLADACHDLGVAAEFRGDVDEAVAFYTRAARMSPEALHALALRRLDEQREAELAHRYVTTQPSNVRSGPGVSHGRVALLPENTDVTKLEAAGDWWKVRLDDGREVWIYATLLTNPAS